MSDSKDGESTDPDVDEIQIDEHGQIGLGHNNNARQKVIEPLPPTEESNGPGSRLIMDPPTLGGTLTANSQPEALDPSTDPLGVSAPQGPMLNHQTSEETPDVTLPEPEPEEPVEEEALPVLLEEVAPPPQGRVLHA